MLRNAEYPEGMPLQADPTIKYAWKRFDLKRIYNNLDCTSRVPTTPTSTLAYPQAPSAFLRLPASMPCLTM